MACAMGDHPPEPREGCVFAWALLDGNAIVLKNKVSYEMAHAQHQKCFQVCVDSAHSLL